MTFLFKVGCNVADLCYVAKLRASLSSPSLSSPSLLSLVFPSSSLFTQASICWTTGYPRISLSPGCGCLIQMLDLDHGPPGDSASPLLSSLPSVHAIMSLCECCACRYIKHKVPSQPLYRHLCVARAPCHSSQELYWSWSCWNHGGEPCSGGNATEDPSMPPGASESPLSAPLSAEDRWTRYTFKRQFKLKPSHHSCV